MPKNANTFISVKLSPKLLKLSEYFPHNIQFIIPLSIIHSYVLMLYVVCFELSMYYIVLQ